MTSTKIIIGKKENRVFLHILGDNTEYYDVVSLQRNHPEASDYIMKNKFMLNRLLFEERDRYEAYSTV